MVVQREESSFSIKLFVAEISLKARLFLLSFLLNRKGMANPEVLSDIKGSVQHDTTIGS